MSSAATCPAGTPRFAPPRRAPASRAHRDAPAPTPTPAPAFTPAAIQASDEQVLSEVAREIFADVFGLLRRLQPLHPLGLDRVGTAALVWTGRGLGLRGLRSGRDDEAWTRLVPGFDAMDCLVGLMTDRLCT